MKRVYELILCLLILANISVRADEGMWLLPLLEELNMLQMDEMGCKLTAQDIYNVNNGSLKDAVVMFGNKCTGEIVSEKGLLFTNHHCGYDEIQNHSTIEHDYLKDGFWAKSFEEELPNPGLTVSFLVRVENVTDEVLNRLSDTLNNEQRSEELNKVSEELEEKATEGSHYEASVESFYEGNRFYLFVYEIFKDVRLVGTPPSSIGKFGYDTDNWVWPRHTGDFSIFRVYTGPDGKPAEYSKENIPLKPKHYLPISLNGISEGDFAMTLGYPGTTQRYITSAGIKEIIEVINPAIIKIRGARQDILLEDMLADEKVNIQYSSKYSRSSNYWKYAIGQNQGLRRLKVLDKKKELEDRFSEWVNQDQARLEKYSDAVAIINSSINDRRPFQYANLYLRECFFRATEAINFSILSLEMYFNLNNNNPDKDEINNLVNMMDEHGEEFFEEYHSPTDKKVTAKMIKLFYENVPQKFQPSFYQLISSRYKGNIDKFVDAMFAKSIFVSKDKFDKFLKNPSKRVLEKDLVFQVMLSVSEKYFNNRDQMSEDDTLIQLNEKKYMAGLMEMQKNKTFYPDANFTMRLSYGTVEDYFPRDAVHYDYLTTLAGVMEKEDPNNWEFVVSDKLKELYKEKDYGRYGIDGKMPVCFITNNDITGGNSGSPVINNEGSLVGLAFDGNWEAMSGDIAYEPELQRTICVDIRYVLFIIDKYAGAEHLIKELKIIE